MDIKIPKQSDATIVAALAQICKELNPDLDFFLKVVPHADAPNPVEVEVKGEAAFAPIKYILVENSEIIQSFQLYDRTHTGLLALELSRTPAEITDVVRVNWPRWGNSVGSPMFVKLQALVRNHFKAASVVATLDAKGEGADRYIDSQRVILSSLEETAKSILVDANRHLVALEHDLRTRYARLEESLRTDSKEAEARFEEERSRRVRILEEREAALKRREESFETKEARYVARDEQQKQLDQIKGWIEKWGLTSETRKKRWPVIGAATLGAAVAGYFTLIFSQQGLSIIQGKNLTEVLWWQWGLLTLKPTLSFLALTTVLVYFTRWTSAWASQHADEEFRNRARMLDIGRSKWLLEAVRDAQDNDKEFPSELLKDLSRNLFVTSTSQRSPDDSTHVANELFLQGLSSLRLKSADGIEVEAKRGEKNK